MKKPLILVEKDRVGFLADLAYILSKEKINIETISAHVMGPDAIIVLTVNDYKKALDVLKKNGYNVLEEDYILLKLEDKPGMLYEVSSKLKEARINIEKIFVIARDGKKSIVALRCSHMRKARDILREYLLEEEEA